MKICPKCKLKYQDDDLKCFVDGAVLETMPDERIGQVIAGRYLIERQLGEGGMATVYRARHTLVDRPVAIKIMAHKLAKDASLRERFRREAKNAATLAHPNIIEIFDTGDTEDGTAFLVMELLDGLSLADLIEQQGKLPWQQVVELGLQMSRGLARAHDFQVIHRDLKPDNIYITKGRDGRQVVKLLDFGIARSMQDSRLTNSGELFGTPQYMAPERVTSIDAGPQADLYAIGVIFFEMVTGRVPFDSPDLPGILIAHMQDPVPKLDSLVQGVPRKLEELITKLLAKKPEERPVDAHQVIKELSALAPQDSSPQAAFAPPPMAAAPRPVAATLPPTTLERWAKRTAVFDQMLRRAYPQGAPPADLQAMLQELRGVLTRINELRSAGLKEQRKLDALEANARESRTRLGHAFDTLAIDLSTGREAARAARTEVQPYFDHDQQCANMAARAHQKLMAIGGAQQIIQPTPELAQAFRETADAVDRWALARNGAEKARRWLEAKDREVSDLEFQVEALRGQRSRLEAQFEVDKTQTEVLLQQSGKEVERLDQQLMAVAARFCEPLRPRRDLTDLFAELEGQA